MDLLDRYLHAVRFWLPEAQQKDIIEELGDDIRSQIEDKESALGRPVNEDELAAILRQTGQPMRVAGALSAAAVADWAGTFFTLYKFVLKMVAIFSLVPVGRDLDRSGGVCSFASRGQSRTHPSWRMGILVDQHPCCPLESLPWFSRYWKGFSPALKALQKWDPRKLPAVPTRKDRVPRLESVFELVFSGLFILGLAGASWNCPGGVCSGKQSPGGEPCSGRPITGWVLIPTCLGMAQQLLNLFRPQWIWLRPPTRLLSTAITLWIV